MDPVGATTNAAAELGMLVPLLEHTGHGQIAIVGNDGAFEGVVTARRMAEQLAAGADTAKAGDLVEQPRTVHASSSLAEALPALESGVIPVVAVLDEEGRTLVGWLTSRNMLAAETIAPV